jgi:hypothetical protein
MPKEPQWVRIGKMREAYERAKKLGWEAFGPLFKGMTDGAPEPDNPEEYIKSLSLTRWSPKKKSEPEKK